MKPKGHLTSLRGFRWFLLAAGVFLLEAHGAKFPMLEDLKTVDPIDAPPAGKALVNFLRPSEHIGEIPVDLYDTNGVCLVHVLGGTRFQLLCEPGPHVWIGSYPLNVSVVKAEVEAGKIYDVVIDRKGMGFSLLPLAKGDARRAQLPEFERQARPVAYLSTERVTKYEQKQKPDLEKIQRDFLGGKKSDRLKVIGKDDCR